MLVPLACLAAFAIPPGCREATGPNTSRIRWSYLDELPAAVPFVDQDLVAFTTSLEANRINALDRTDGHLRWSKSFPVVSGYGMPRANVAAFEDMLIVPAWNVYAVDRATGATRWQFSNADDSPGAKPLTLGDGTVFACGRRLYALDARTGTLKWEVDLQEEPFSPVYAYGVLYLTTRINRGGGLGAGHAMAIDPATGSIVWSFPLPDATDAPWLGGSVGLAGVTESQVIVPSRNGRVYALDRLTGALRWERRGRGPYDWGILLNSVVVVGGDALYLEAINLSSGNLSWELGLEGSALYISSAPGLAVVNDGRLHAVNENGKEVWAYGGDYHNEPSFSWAPAYADHTLFVGASIGGGRRGLYAVDFPF